MKPSNPKFVSEVEHFVNCLDSYIENYYKEKLKGLEVPKIVLSEGSKFYKLVLDTSVWGFISKYDGMFKGKPIKCGDLMKPATWTAPAKTSRGNILDGNARYGVYGPDYLK